MSNKFFLDTNIFIYSFDGGAKAKSKRASQLIRIAIESQKGSISYQVVQEFFNVALTRFQLPLKTEEAEQYFATVFRPLLKIHSSPALYLEALELRSRYRLSWYDSVIVASALQARCDLIFTEDLQHGQQIGTLKVENPFLST
jgi:predicted nucleic acid-binding protein